MCLMSSSKGIDIWLEIVCSCALYLFSVVPLDSSENYKLLLQNSSPRNIFLKWDFKVHIRPLSLYRPQRVDVDHFG
ncbi:hypothetical protein T01_15781 [Trichinella spiralis]|uniref:Uncharacterized protein n=1 Tax=Trichinella spiralis TaxID=6334 RepID=A0A0V1BJ21_TRISP|nr:hypothetical protein T01_15781 [Trichinella spiralis]